MRPALSFLTSFLVHVGVLAAAVYWLPPLPSHDFHIASGQARMLEASSPSLDRQAAPEQEVTVETVVQEARPTPMERRPPTSQERPQVIVEVAADMIPVPPESRAPVDEKHQPEHAQQAKVLPKQSTQPPSPVSSRAAPAAIAVIDPGAKINAPREVTTNLPPHYPVECLLNGIEGQVMVRIWIAADGHVERAALEKTSGNASLDSSALAAVGRWRFHPATRGGAPLAYEMIKPVKFTIRKG